MFPGQGSQHLGMGSDFVNRFDQAARLFDQANDILGVDLKAICADGPEETLNKTEISQPAIFVTSVAILQTIQSGEVASHLTDVSPCAYAGLSLGEYTALYAAGVMDFKQALKLVQIRGQSMQQAADLRDGTMVSILGTESENIEALCQTVLEENLEESDGQPTILKAVNFNCPGQIVLSGSIKACQRAEELASDFGASRAIPLTVAGAFHTAMMEPAAQKLSLALSETSFTKFTAPVIANVNAENYSSPQDIPKNLMAQLTQPVRWQQSIEALLDQGVERFVEIGAGRVLTGLVKKISHAKKIKPTIETIGTVS
jgi:[acyl-carrier-protein] S-malonyltransferase